jgi:hypothetical protein
MARRRLDVREAAEVLGTTVDAVRKRIARGSLEAEKEDGTVYVWLDTGQPMAGQVDGSGELVEELRSRVRFVERQLEAERQAHSEARRLLAAALERIPPQLEAPERPPESPSEATGPPDSGGVPPASGGAQEGTERVSWWRRVFGG